MHPSHLREMTIRGVILGALITIVFTAANVYLGLKVGMTFASAIPAAVISMALLRNFKGSNILENNMVQTQASAAGTLSAVIFILPSLLILGYWTGFPFWQAALVCAAGGILGVLYTVPLRRVMVVQSQLPYPEGVAAAEVLKLGHTSTNGDLGEQASRGMRTLLAGSSIAALYGLCSGGFKLLGESFSAWFTTGPLAFRVATGFSPALIAAGYLMGAAAGLSVIAGVVLSWAVLVPVLNSVAVPSGLSAIESSSQVWSTQVRFIGAGLIGIAAIWTVLNMLKPIIGAMRASAGNRSTYSAHDKRAVPDTDRDMSTFAMAGIAALVFVVLLAIVYYFLAEGVPQISTGLRIGLSLLCVLFVFVFGFLIAAACGYMAGLVGSSSSPISGIGIIGVILVSLLLLLLTQLAPAAMQQLGGKPIIALALFTTAVVIAVAAISNDNLQDLKTGYLVGATPARQQWVLVIGCIVGSLVIPPVLELLYNAYGFSGAMPRPDMDVQNVLAAPQATLMAAIASGIFDGSLNWNMLLTGVAIGAVVIAIDWALRATGKGAMPALAVGLGIYLPPTIGVTLFIGAMLGFFIERAIARREQHSGNVLAAENARRTGVLLASGLIVGESLMGLVIAGLIGVTGQNAPIALVGPGFAYTAQWLGLAFLVAVCVFFYRQVVHKTSWHAVNGGMKP
ncbi:oligopeptide transporter, OPT family [Lampropedia aestuarii]|uniref:Oligopeptide transporter, OPT family n=1 Tax=Lampropedia aestuarii TaxID=2562762 RepID=A0A4S5BJE0_9BURK|nr:oligopeptide transporter, OPT family [Lampropedia aestuarii]THJ32289.1 oligopeptide transporter, OPT family [Lampropedia aestuarii]